MYCIKCGVKLADTENSCPLCGTAVYHPDIKREAVEKSYPEGKLPQVKRSSKTPQILASVAAVLPILIVLLCDLQINARVIWSGYVIGAILVFYISFLLPAWFRAPNPVIFVPCAFLSVGVYILYICLKTDGDWFLTFAFPTVGGVALIVITVVTLLRYVRRGTLYILGGASIAFGILMVMIEFLIAYTFDIARFIGWSLYPMIVFVLLGGTFIFLAVNRTVREAMERKFFI